MKISLTKILQIVNFTSLILTWYLFITEGGNEYINLTSVILCTILSIQAYLFLKYADKQNNPLIFILSFQLVIYYVIRICTLLYVPYSMVFLRLNAIDFNDCNYTLIFIILSNIFLFLGIYLANTKEDIISSTSLSSSLYMNNNNDKIYGTRLVLIILFTYFLAFSDFLKFDSIVRLAGFVRSIFLNPYTILLLSIVYFIYYFSVFDFKIKIFTILLIILFIVIVTLNGSRSGVLTIIVFYIIANLAIQKYISFNYIYVVILTFIILPLSLFLFLTSTYIRKVGADELNVKSKIDIVKNYEVDLSADNRLVFAPVFDRIGFFDYATEIIAHKQQYKEVFNLIFYSKSIIDNSLSPGFDVFDTPKLSNSLMFMYDDTLGSPSKKIVVDEYHSDEFTIYGEYYSLFWGYGSLVMFFITGYLFQKILNRKSKLTGVTSAIQKALVLLVFYTLINSFGIDWLIFDLVGIFVCYFLFAKLIIRN